MKKFSFSLLQKFVVVKHVSNSSTSKIPVLFFDKTTSKSFKCFSTKEIFRKFTSTNHRESNADIYTNFDSVYQCLVDDLVDDVQREVPEAKNWFKKVINYNVPHGKRNRGLAVVQSLLHLRGSSSLSDLTEEERRLVMVLGWCIEFLQAFFLVADDIMDQSSTRRGMPCWYTQKDVGLVAVNDAIFLEACVYHLLRKHLKAKEYYLDVIELFHDITFKTISGQCLDTMVEGREDGWMGRWMDECTMDKYHRIVDHKTGYYSFYLPAACALYMEGIRDMRSHEECKRILLQMARHFQIQDDYLDCYGDPSVTGKVGTDIEDKKCSWLLVEALSRTTPLQRSSLQENYGIKDAKCVAVVKQIYADLQMDRVFEDFQEDSHRDILTLIDRSTSKLPKKMFLHYAEKIYKRKK